MDHPTRVVATLAQDLIRIDSRSSVSNRPLAERLKRELAGFELDEVAYVDEDGIDKVVLAASRGRGGLAFSGHMDTVPDTGWLTDPWSGQIEDGVLSGLGSADMKGPLAAMVVAARTLPGRTPVALLLTTDEETTKAGARAILGSGLLQRYAPCGIVVGEPTGLAPVRGHRSHIEFLATATGTQAHSSTGRGRNANWDLVPFLSDLRRVHDRLRHDRLLQDSEYDPPFSDFNLVIDNYGSAVNVTVPKATVRIKFRFSASIDPAPIIGAVRMAAESAGLRLSETRQGKPLDLPASHPLVQTATELSGRPARTAAYGTDAAELQAIAPCIVLGPGDISVAHTPHEAVRLAELADAVPLYQSLAKDFARREAMP